MSPDGAVRVSTWAQRTPPPAVAVRRAGSTVTLESARVSTSTPWSTPATGPCPVVRTATGIPRSAAKRTAARTSCSSVAETAMSGAGIAERSNPAQAAAKPGVPGRRRFRLTVLFTGTPSPPALQPGFNAQWSRWNRGAGQGVALMSGPTASANLAGDGWPPTVEERHGNDGEHRGQDDRRRGARHPRGRRLRLPRHPVRRAAGGRPPLPAAAAAGAVGRCAGRHPVRGRPTAGPRPGRGPDDEHGAPPGGRSGLLEPQRLDPRAGRR